MTDSYQIYDTTSRYAGSGDEAIGGISFLASGLCVGGIENTKTSDIDSSYAEYAAFFSVADGEVDYALNIYDRIYPASTTKILTCLLALEYGNTDDLVTVSEEAIASLDSSSSRCGLSVGDRITLEDLLYGLMLSSGNDAANVIAEYISGSAESFADLMNQKALELGAVSSHFTNPHGLPDDDHYTTVYDLYLIFQEAVRDERFTDIISTASITVPYEDADGAERELTFENTNLYLSGERTAPEGVSVIGGKTGTTSAAGNCLALYSLDADSNPVISIVCKAGEKDDMYDLMDELLEKFAT